MYIGNVAYSLEIKTPTSLQGHNVCIKRKHIKRYTTDSVNGSLSLDVLTMDSAMLRIGKAWINNGRALERNVNQPDYNNITAM